MYLLVRGDARRLPIADGSVHCVVTSPPYFSLRDYGTGRWIGGDSECDHREPGTDRGKRGELPNPPAGWAERSQGQPYRSLCGKCGARRVDAQLGLEPTPDDFVSAMVGVFREVKRVLHPSGACFINIGDSYAGSWGAQSRNGETSDGSLSANQIAAHPHRQSHTGTIRQPGLKPKDLCMIPARLALALQADGWYLRSEIIWAKPNPMPESVTDRPTKSHEQVYLLSKQERYYYDAEAVREIGEGYGRSERFRGDKYTNNAAFNNSREWADSKGGGRNSCDGSGRNLRSVWTIATESYAGAHFATYPRKLVEPCIRAGTSERGCCPAMIPKLRLKRDLPPEKQEQVMRYLKSKRLV